MARYAYDVNTTQRLIDVHKQFQGGLKTVDTDDALGAVFLRQAENVSLSEFGFIEKRYGTYENFKQQVTGKLQGYWEFQDEIIFAANGNLYIVNQAKPELSDKVIDYYLDTDLRHPNLDDVFGAGDYSLRDNGARVRVQKVNTFQNTRDMNAVTVNNVLYIFTGTYPVYVVKENNDLKVYLFNITIPTYDEIVVTGHNFLEDNFEDVYGYDSTNKPTPSSSYIGAGAKPIVYSIEHFPKLPYRVSENGTKGTIDFTLNTGLPNMDVWNPNATQGLYTEIELDSIQFRTSGAGASDLDFNEANKEDITFDLKTNYSSGDPVDFEDIPYLEKEPFDSTSTMKEQSQRFTYFLNGAFVVKKEDFLKYNQYNLKFYKNQTDSEFGAELFDMSQFGSYGFADEIITAQIIPLDASGNERKGKKLKLEYITGITVKNGAHRLVIPEDIYQAEDVVSYKVIFKTEFKEFKDNSNEDLIYRGPYLFATNPELYYYSFVPIGEKFPATTGNLITSSLAPRLSAQLVNLISGTYDFRVTFARKTYSYNSSAQILTLQGVEYFGEEIKELTITEEKLEDYPGAADELKIKAVWSCNKVIEHFNKLMIWGSTEMPTAVFYSFPDRPTYFPSKFYLDFPNDEGSALQNVTPYMNILVAQTEDRTWGIRGNSGYIDSPAPYVPFIINPTVGTIAYKSVRPVRNHLFFLSKQGMIALKSLYAADEQYNIEFVDLNIRNIVPQDKRAVGIQFDNQYWLNFPDSGITLRWYIDKKAWVQDKYTAWEDFNGILKWQVVDGQLEFITHPSRFENEGNNYMYKIGVDYSLPTDLGDAVVAKFETSYLNQNYPFHPKNYKEAKLDFTLQNEYNLGRNALYEMDTNEDIVGTVHTIQATILKNHRYRLQYNFAEEETTIVDGGVYQTPDNQYTETLDGGAAYITASDALDLLYYYAVGSVIINGVFADIYPINYNTVEFLVPNNGGGDEITVIGSFTGYEDGASLFDASYSNSLTFKTWVISEDQTLNIDNYEGYDQATTDVNVDLEMKDRLGDWVFGTSDFGNKVTAVKTIKLSGKGYNAKLYMEDYTRSKWTLESLGLTYKMKRARSR